MKNISSRELVFMIIATFVFIYDVKADDCRGIQLSARLHNIELTAPNKVEFDMQFKITGSTTFDISALSGALVYNPAVMNGGRLTVNTSRIGSFSVLANLVPSVQSKVNTLFFTQKPSKYNAQLTQNWLTGFHVILTNTVNFNLCTDFTLSLSSSPNSIFCATAFCNGASNSSNLCVTQGNFTFTSPTYSLSSSAISCSSSFTKRISHAICSNEFGALEVNLNRKIVSGNYSMDDSKRIPFSTNPFRIDNLSLGTHTISITTVDDCGLSCPTLTDTFQILAKNIIGKNTTYVSACDSFIWSVNHQTYFSSGTYTQVAACTTEVLDLVILPSPKVATSNALLCPNSSVTLSGTPSGGVFSVTNPYSGTTPMPFTYSYTNKAGCSASANANIIGINTNAPQINTQIITTASTAQVNWNTILGASSYILSYKVNNTNTWSHVTTISNHANLTGLIANSTYQVRVKALFSSCSQESNYSVTTTFVTGSAPCNNPTILTAVNLPIKKIKFTWSSINGVGQYNIWYRLVGSGSWIAALIPGTLNTFTTSALANGTYEYKIRNRCSAATTFSTFSSLQNVVVIQKVVEKELNASFNVFPNPTEGRISIELVSLRNTNANIKIYNIIGRLLKQVPISVKEGANNYQLDLRDCAAGLYMVQLFEGNKLSYVRKIRKSN
jgi:hypothetical protein